MFLYCFNSLALVFSLRNYLLILFKIIMGIDVSILFDFTCICFFLFLLFLFTLNIFEYFYTRVKISL